MNTSIKNIYVYGAGKYGEFLADFLIELGTEIKAFIQTDEVEMLSMKLRGNNYVPIISVRKFLNDYKKSFNEQSKCVVFIAIYNKTAVYEIKQHLFNEFKSVNSIEVYDFSDFIDNNLLYYQSNIGNNECSLCGNKFNEFLPGGNAEKIFEIHKIIGGGIRTQCFCPFCDGIDRERWLDYVLINKTDIFTRGGCVLHFAPEKETSKKLKNNIKIDYYSGDIVPGRAMHVVDITNIQFKDDVFDYIICNHVLEHISDIEKAISEIKRVLKPSGFLIFSFPICQDMKTFEDKSITSKEERVKCYGQEDHVRMYGTDFSQIYENYGMKLKMYSPQEELDKEQILKLGLISDDVIIIGQFISECDFSNV